ncbi:MAG: RES domain-containing protein, partial [Bacteroidota bacterium]
FRDRISRALSKPMRRYDSQLEYIPTQFICEFIKVNTGADGIRFSSSLHPAGKNYVAFDQNLFECKKVSLLRITSLKLESSELLTEN